MARESAPCRVLAGIDLLEAEDGSGTLVGLDAGDPSEGCTECDSGPGSALLAIAVEDEERGSPCGIDGEAGTGDDTTLGDS